MALQWRVQVHWDGGGGVNLLANPSFETNQTGWSVLSGTFAVNSRITTRAYMGDACNQLSNNSGSTAIVGTTFTADATTSTISLWVYRVSGNGSLLLKLQQNFGGFTVLGTTTVFPPVRVWTRVTVTGATSIGSVYRLRVDEETDAVYYIDAAQAEGGAVATGYYDGEKGDESDPLMELHTRRGRNHLVRGANGLEPMGIGEATLTLRNIDGRYDPLNADSPLYPDVAPGKVVRVFLDDSADGGKYAVFTGHLYDIRPIQDAQSKRVQMVLRDGWQWLKDRTVRLAAQTTYRTDQAITALAAAANYPFDSSIVVGNDKIPFWWASNHDAMSEMQSVVDSEFGILFIQGDGTLTFYPRAEQRKLSPSYHEISGTKLNDLILGQPWDVLRNVIQIRVYPTEVRTKQVLWKSQSPIKVRSGKTITLIAKYNLRTSQDETGLATNVAVGALDIDQPVKSTDIIVTANEDGSGADESVGLAVAVTNKGEEAQIVITNNKQVTLWISRLQLRGKTIIKNNAVTVETDNSGSDPERSFVLDVPWQQDVDKAQLYADYLASYMTNPRAAITVRTYIAGAEIQCKELFTDVLLNVSAVGVQERYRICGNEQNWSAQSPNLLNTLLHLEPRDTNDYIVLDTYQVGGAEVLAY